MFQFQLESRTATYIQKLLTRQAEDKVAYLWFCLQNKQQHLSVHDMAVKRYLIISAVG